MRTTAQNMCKIDQSHALASLSNVLKLTSFDAILGACVHRFLLSAVL